MKQWIQMFVCCVLVNSAVYAELPQYLTFDIKTDSHESLTVQMEKRSYRADQLEVIIWDENGYRAGEVSDLPEVRTYRGYVKGQPQLTVSMYIKEDGLAYIMGLDAKGTAWQSFKVDLSKVITSTQATQPFVVTPPVRPKNKDTTRGIAEQQPNTKVWSQPVIPPHDKYPLYADLYSPKGGIQVMPMALAIHHDQIIKPGLASEVAFREGEVALYNHLLTRDLLVTVEVTIYILYMAPNMPELARNKKIHKEMMTDPFLQNYTNWEFIAYGGGGGSAGPIGSPGKAHAAANMTHEGTHSWGGGHGRYGVDTQGTAQVGSKSAKAINIGPINIERALTIRRSIITDPENDALRPYVGIYPDRVNPYAYLDMASTFMNTFVDIPVLDNDYDAKGLPVGIYTFTARTDKGGVVERIPGNILRYTPPENYTGKDVITYDIINTEGMTSKDLVFIEVINRDLTVHYSFEETDGSMTSDLSGHGHDGQLLSGQFETASSMGILGHGLMPQEGLVVDPTRVISSSIKLGQGDYGFPYDFPMETGNHFDPMNEDYSISFWFRALKDPSLNSIQLLRKVFTRKEVSTGFYLQAQDGGIKLRIEEFGNKEEKVLFWNQGLLGQGSWTHVAFTIDRTTDTARLFVNGIEANEVIALDPGSYIFNGRVPLILGNDAFGTAVFDEFKLYTRALSSAEMISEYTAVTKPVSAPAPAMAAADVPEGKLSLSWDTTEQVPVISRVYFGQDEGAVKRGDTVAFLGETNSAHWDVTVSKDQTYYWRVDKVMPDQRLVQGFVWRFTVDPSRAMLLNGLYAWWGFNETSGQETYDAIKGRVASLEGTVISRADGVIGSCLHWPYGYTRQDDGQSVELHDSVVKDDMTLSIWYHAESKDNIKLMTGGYSLTLDKFPKFYLKQKYGISGRGSQNGLLPPSNFDGSWHHLLVTRKGELFELYINGQSFGIAVTPTQINSARTVITLGDGCMEGGVDEIMIWDRALSPVERALLFNDYLATAQVKRWEKLPGQAIQDLTDLTAYPELPDSTSKASRLSILTQNGEAFGIQMESLFVPNKTGSHHFSADEKFGRTQLQMNLSGRDPKGPLTEVGKSVELQAGKAYYMKGLFVVESELEDVKIKLAGKYAGPDEERTRIIGWPRLQPLDMPENSEPKFIQKPLLQTRTMAAISNRICGSLSNYVYDPDPVEKLRFAKTSGPDWIHVNEDGTYFGKLVAMGHYEFSVKVTDRMGSTDMVTINLDLVKGPVQEPSSKKLNKPKGSKGKKKKK